MEHNNATSTDFLNSLFGSGRNHSNNGYGRHSSEWVEFAVEHKDQGVPIHAALREALLKFDFKIMKTTSESAKEIEEIQHRLDINEAEYADLRENYKTYVKAEEDNINLGDFNQNDHLEDQNSELEGLIEEIEIETEHYNSQNNG